MYSVVDMLGVEGPVEMLRSLKELPDIVLIHRASDGGKSAGNLRLDQAKAIKGAFKDKKLLVAVTGEVTPDIASELVDAGADILVASRFITQARDVEHSVRQFLESTREIKGDIDQLREHIE
jgi:3-keto-L-gulonate-6-phosphate decarboxylase